VPELLDEIDRLRRELADAKQCNAIMDDLHAPGGLQ
jgi:hypothetical protein